MLATEVAFTFGRASTCDLQVPDDRKHIAAVHIQFDRLINSLRASLKGTDVSSRKNDVVIMGEVAEREWEMGAGDWFQIGDSRFFAMNDEMRHGRRRALEILGVRQHDVVDDLLVSAVKDSRRHILLIGEPGSDQDRLARIIHHCSHRRHNRYEVLAAHPRLDPKTRQQIADASHGTVLVQMHGRGKLEPRLVTALLDPLMSLRLVLCAKSPDKAEASFPGLLVSEAKRINIPALRSRVADVPELLNQWLIARRSKVRFALLRAELREGIRGYTWPGNIEELRETADILAELAHFKSARQAASARLTRGQLRGWGRKLGVTLKLPIIPDSENDSE